MKQNYENGIIFTERMPQCKMCKFPFIDQSRQKGWTCKQYSRNDIPSFVQRCEKECLLFEPLEFLSIDLSNESTKDILSGIFGFCIGYTLGVPVEFSSREDRESDPVAEMRAYGTYQQYFGTWSDDTSLTLCLMDSLRNGYHPNNIRCLVLSLL